MSDENPVVPLTYLLDKLFDAHQEAVRLVAANLQIKLDAAEKKIEGLETLRNRITGGYLVITAAAAVASWLIGHYVK